MELSIKRLDPAADEPLYHIAFGWLEDAPRWRKEAEGVFGTLDREAYLTAATDPARMDVGVFDGPEFVALIALVLRARGVLEVYLEARPRISPTLLVQAAQSVAHQLFTSLGIQVIYSWVPACNRAVHKLNKAIGFQTDHVTMLRGTVRGKPLDWQRYSLPNPYGATH